MHPRVLLRFAIACIIFAGASALHGTTHQGVVLDQLDVRASTGTVTLLDVAFVASPGPAPVTVHVDATTDGLIRFNAGTDFSGAALVVHFDPEEPGIQETFELFRFDGSGWIDPNFVQVTTPPGWVLDDGILRFTGGLPPDREVLSQWAASFGLNGLQSLPDSNPAGDGLTNLAKFAFGLDPTVPAAGPLSLSREGDSVFMRWNWRKDPRVEYHVESTTSPSAGVWAPVTSAAPANVDQPDPFPPEGYRRVEWPVALADESGFYRIRADVAAPVFGSPELTAADVIEVEGVVDGGVYTSPFTPVISVMDGYATTLRLNGAVYSGGAITSQGMHVLEVTAQGPAGEFVLERDFVVITPGVRAPTFTIPMKLQHLRQVRRSPHVRGTVSGDPWFVLGQSLGWPADPYVPPHDLHGYQISDFSVPSDNKVRIILSDGNHPTEHTGSWGHRGIIDFLLSDEPEAQTLRRMAVFYVYPMVNPDGRYRNTGRGNPEMSAVGLTDHNRIWNTVGQFSTIDVLTNAMRADTGGTAHYLLDFHSASSSFFYSLSSMIDTPWARAITARDNAIRPVVSAGNAGMLRLWSMSSAGLSVRLAYTPEFASAATAVRSLEIGRNYGLGVHDFVTGTSILNELDDILGGQSGSGIDPDILNPILAARQRLLAAAAADDALTVIDEVNLIDGLIQGLRDAAGIVQVALGLIESSQSVLEVTDDGFAGLMQGAVSRGVDTLQALLDDPTTSPTDLQDAIEALNLDLDAYWLVADGTGFPPVDPRVIDDAQVSWTISGASEWNQGFLVNLTAASGSLLPTGRHVLDFDGSSTYVITSFVPGASMMGNRFTWEFQALYRNFANNTGSSGNAGESPRLYTQLTSATGGFRTAVGGSYWTSTTLEETDRWYHFAIVYDEGTVRTYVDGRLVDTRPNVSFSGTSPSPFSLGRGFGSARFLNGYTREHRIWKSVRTEAQLRTYRNRSLAGSDPDLLAYWKVNEGTGSTVADHANGLYHGTVVSGSWTTLPRPGFYISQPVRFTGIGQVSHSSIDWQEDAAADEPVSVWVGSSDSADALPARWLPAVRGGPVPGLEPGTDPGGRTFWIRVNMDATGSAVAPSLQSLTIELH